jgi:serine/threonine-protein kinase
VNADDGETGAEGPSEILDAWLKARERGEAPSPPTEEWLARHPEQAAALRARVEVIEDLVEVLGDGTPPAAASALANLDPATCPPSRPVLLREERDDGPPLLSSRATVEGRYQIAGEIARGGMGVVLKGYDVDLAREVAVKVLRDDHAGRPDLVRRFVEEAQVGGQLQHPGVPPVYEIGVDGARRPYFAMKLVRGRTLSALLHDPAEGKREPTGFLATFASICQTVAYAHSRGVIHRDLKPSNVMVGSFGEVLVMDWGMAKVLARGGVEDDRRSQTASEVSPVRTVRSGPASGSDSQVGSVMGTGPYRAPEQARGEVHALDERTDVFGLGAILCEILTGKPPYLGTAQEVLAKAVHADLAEAHARIASSGADPSLVDLATRCLAPSREERPRDGGAVAHAVTAYLSSIEERKRAAEADLARAEVRTVEERKRRRLSVGLLAAVLGLVVLGGGGWVWLDAQRRSREEARGRLVTEALDETTRLRARASDVVGWTKAVAAARRAEALSRDGDVGASDRDRAVRALAEVETEATAVEDALRRAEDDRRLVERLDEIRQSFSSHFKGVRVAREIHAALAEAGLDPHVLGARGYAAALRDPIRLPVLLALGEWRERARRGKASTEALDAVLDVCDSDPWRARLRAARTIEDLRQVAADAAAAEPAVESLVALADRLGEDGDPERALDLAKRAWERRPDDFWANYSAARWARGCNPRRPDEGLRFAVAAVALRPESAGARHALGNARLDLDDLAGAETAYRDALRLEPGLPLAHFGMGLVSQRRGHLAEAEASFREAIRARPDYSEALNELGDVLGERGDAAGEERAYRDAIDADPANARAHDGLGTVLYRKGDLAGAAAEHREAIRLDPDLDRAHNNLGVVLDERGDLDGAAAAYAEAIRLAPPGSSWSARLNLAIVLEKKGDLARSEAEYREALRFGAPAARVHNGLGLLRARQGDLVGAEEEFRAAVRADPRWAHARGNVAQALRNRGELDRAVVELSELLRDLRSGSAGKAGVVRDARGGTFHAVGEPEVADVYGVLVEILVEIGAWPRALEVSREAVEACPTSPHAWFGLGVALFLSGPLSESIAALERSRGLDPTWRSSAATAAISLAEEHRRIEERLPALLSGREAPRDADDAARIAERAHLRGHFAFAAALYEGVLPQVPPDAASNLLYGGACAAARAATAAEADVAAPSDAERGNLRRKAAAWLRRALSRIEEKPRDQRWEVVRELRRWQRDPDLAGLRGRDALARLPAEERAPLEALWGDVERIAADRGR